MSKDEYTPRRARYAKKRHRLRNTLIVLILLACAAFAVLRWGLPWWLDTVTPDDGTPAQSDVVTSTPDTSAAASQPDTSTPASEPEPEPQPDAATDDPAASAQTSGTGEQTAGTFAGEIDPLMLVNSTHALPEGYTVELTELSNGQSVATLIYPALQQMFDDARAQGIYPIVASGYRTPEKQQSLMDEKVQSLVEQGYSQESAQTEALKWVNQVGYSEHQSGLAVDINADGIHSAGYEVYDWLAQNAWQYGFILRYPEDKTDITGTGYEPWHYRYVGVEAAQAITQQGVCLEEYLGEE